MNTSWPGGKPSYGQAALDCDVTSYDMSENESTQSFFLRRFSLVETFVKISAAMHVRCAIGDPNRNPTAIIMRSL